MKPEILKTLKSKLPRHHARILSEQLKVSKVYVTYVLSGRRNSDKVIDAAIELAQQYQKEQEARIRKIQNL